MPRDGSGVYSADWVNAAPNTTIESSKQNAMVADLVTDANAARPITAGGTAATTAAGARDALGLEIGSDIPSFAAVSGLLYGLTLSNNVTDATNDIDIAVGSATDSTNANVMTLASALTKRLDAAWAVGTGNGGLDTGAIANTTYHVWLIKRVDTGVVDALFSTSATAPTMPANYTLKRRIGSFLRVSGAIKAFSQVGDEFLYTVPAADYASTTLGTSRENIAISTPAGVVVTALMRVVMTNAAITHVKISAQGETDTINSATGDTSIVNSVAGIITAGVFRVRAGTNSQITARASNANTDLRIATYGYIDRRGRDA